MMIHFAFTQIVDMQNAVRNAHAYIFNITYVDILMYIYFVLFILVLKQSVSALR